MKRSRRVLTEIAEWVILIVLAIYFIYPTFYSDTLPPAISNPILQSRADLESLISEVTGSISSSIRGVPPVNSAWADEFFAAVNQARENQSQDTTCTGSGAAVCATSSSATSSPLTPCTSLNSFAQFRFDDMTTGKNYEISHYNYQSDFQSYYPNASGSFEEEYFFPSGYSPSAYVSNIENVAPVHWQGLMNPTYQSYGFYIGKGPIIGYYGVAGSCSAPSEIDGEGVNMTQVASGCNIVVTTGTWFVIELSSSCP